MDDGASIGELVASSVISAGVGTDNLTFPCF